MTLAAKLVQELRASFKFDIKVMALFPKQNKPNRRHLKGLETLAAGEKGKSKRLRQQDQDQIRKTTPTQTQDQAKRTVIISHTSKENSDDDYKK